MNREFLKYGCNKRIRTGRECELLFCRDSKIMNGSCGALFYSFIDNVLYPIKSRNRSSQA